MGDIYGEFYQKTFKISLLNEIEDLDEDGVEDHYDLDDDGDGFNDSFELDNNFNPRDFYSQPELPMVQTLEVMVGENGVYHLQGKLLNSGRVNIDDLGFILTSSSNYNEELLLIDEYVGSENALFSIALPNLIIGESYHFRAFARNIKGYSEGALKKFVVEAHDQWWKGANVEQGGWMSNWQTG